MDKTTSDAITDVFTFSRTVFIGLLAYMVKHGHEPAAIIEMLEFIDRENERHLTLPQSRKIAEVQMAAAHAHLRKIEEERKKTDPDEPRTPR